jgi:hypothetical protein
MAYRYPYHEEAIAYRPQPLRTDRKMWKLMLFHILTFGISSIFFFIPFSYELEKISPAREGHKLINYAIAYLASLFTFSIIMTIWFFELTKRVEAALEERGIADGFGIGDFWCWYCLGSLILVGPFIYFHKLCKAMNLLCEDYNKSIQAK